MDAVKRHFRPEFLNRIDEMIVFHALTSNDLKQIVTILMDTVVKRFLVIWVITRNFTSCYGFACERRI